MSFCPMNRGDDGPELAEEWPETFFTPEPGKGALGKDDGRYGLFVRQWPTFSC